MPKSILKFGTIVKRSNYLNAKNQNINTDSINNKCNKILAQLENITETDWKNKKNYIVSSISNVLVEMYNSICANSFKEFPLNLIEKFNTLDNNISSYIINEYVNNIIPYMSLTNLSCIEESINRYNINNDQKDIIVNESLIYITADRILENHKTISKRFNIENEILKVNSKGLKYVSESCANMIDTYNLKSYQKLNLCIEEMSYLLDKNNISYNKYDLVEYVTEYFLLGSKINNKILENYKKALTESYILSSNDLINVNYLFESSDDSITICNLIHKYLIDSEKSISLLDSILDDCVNKVDIIDLSYNLDKLLYFILDIYKSDLIEEDLLDKSINTFINNFNKNFDDIIIYDKNVNQEFIDIILNTLVDFVTFVPNTDERVNVWIEYVKKIIEKVNSYSGIPYTKYNLKTIKEINECTESIPFNENKIFKHHNLLRAIHNLDKYLGQKCQDTLSKMKNKSSELKNKVEKILYPDKEIKVVSKLKNIQKDYYNALGLGIKSLFVKEDINPYSYIGSDKKFDIVLANIPIDESDDTVYINQYLSYVCEGFNNNLKSNNYDYLRCYYLISPGNAEVHLKDIHKIIMNEEQYKLYESTEKYDYDFPISKLAEAVNGYQFINSINNKDIENSLFTYFSKGKSMDKEKFDTILEALSLLEVDSNIIKIFANKYLENQFLSLSEEVEYNSEEIQINKSVNNYVPEANVPLDIQLESFLILNALLESESSDSEKEDNDKTEDDKISPEEMEEIKKNPYKGINLKPIKLYLMGLKSKFKDMNQKQKEISKNLDVNYKHLVSSFKNALISDRREAIIKGSVIPSFSKCIKAGIGLGAAYIISGLNPAVPAIIALGSFAVSKHLTKKERILLLDEIQIELEVVEREIQMADREDDIKKVKALLTYKKNLQRQYQRIRYNVKNKGNILPDSSTGVSNEYN